MSPHDAAPSVARRGPLSNVRFYANEWPMVYRTRVLWQPCVFYGRTGSSFTPASTGLCTILKTRNPKETITHSSDYAYNINLTNLDQLFKSCCSIRRPVCPIGSRFQ